MQVILPMKYPVVTCYPAYSNLLSVISQDNDYTTWFLSNFTQLFADKNDYLKGILRLDFYNNKLWSSCPLVFHQKVSRNIVKRASTSIIDFCLESLKENCYIYFIIDMKSISKYNEEHHKVHDIFIYGADTERKVFFAADNFEEGIYSYQEIPFNEVSEGYYLVDELKLDDWLEGVQTINYRKKNVFWDLKHDFKFDINKFLNELFDYLTSFKTVKRYSDPYEQWMLYASDMGFGIEIYDIIVDYLENVDHKNDLRPFFVLWEHKKVMEMRLKYLEKEGYISSDITNSYAIIEKETKLLNKMYLKYVLNQNKEVSNRIVCKLLQIKVKERDVLTIIYNYIKNKHYKINVLND